MNAPAVQEGLHEMDIEVLKANLEGVFGMLEFCLRDVVFTLRWTRNTSSRTSTPFSSAGVLSA